MLIGLQNVQIIFLQILLKLVVSALYLMLCFIETVHLVLLSLPVLSFQVVLYFLYLLYFFLVFLCERLFHPSLLSLPLSLGVVDAAEGDFLEALSAVVGTFAEVGMGIAFGFGVEGGEDLDMLLVGVREMGFNGFGLFGLEFDVFV